MFDPLSAGRRHVRDSDRDAQPALDRALPGRSLADDRFCLFGLENGFFAKDILHIELGCLKNILGKQMSSTSLLQQASAHIWWA